MSDQKTPSGDTATPVAEQITIIGVGLIGGSFALALREAGIKCRFVGHGRNETTLVRARELGIVDQYSTSLKEAVTGSDVVFVATPVGASDAVFASLAGVIEPDTVVTDAGSVKQSVIAAARKQLPEFENFVPAHPIAGTEHSGVEAGFASLYQGKKLILTPLEETSEQAIDKITRLWALTGADIEHMDPERHDQVFAATSHLPHILAFTLVETLQRMEQKDGLLRYAAGGFSDFTRIASSDPVMWRDICLHNSESLLAAVDSLQDGLETLIDAIKQQDGEKIEQLFQIAKETRDHKILNVNQSQVSE